MSNNITECESLDKKTTQYIERHITQKFIDQINKLNDRKVPLQQITRGIALALTQLLANTTEVKNSNEETNKIINEIIPIVEKYQKSGLDFPSQAAALAFCIPPILGINYENLE